MKRIIVFTAIFAAILLFKANAQSEADMKAWQSYMTPGEVHKMMAQADGEWTEDITMWMDPKAPASKTTATSKNEMIMGGRYQVSKTSGTMMGMPFEGMSLIGYDNAKKIFTNVWIDNLGTGTLTMDGPWDAKTNSITFKGKMVDPMTGKDAWVKEVMKFIDKDTQQMEMYQTKDGKEWKSMEIKFTRKM